MVEQLKYYLLEAFRNWWVVALTALTALSLALINAQRATPQYQTSATFVIVPSPLLEDLRDEQRGIDILRDPTLAATYTEVLKSNRIFRAAQQSLQLPDQSVRGYEVRSVVLPSTSVIEVTVLGPDPEIATNMANAIGVQGVNYIRGLQEVYLLDFLDAARIPSTPVSPQPVRDAAFAAVLGTTLGLILAGIVGQITAVVSGYLPVPAPALIIIPAVPTVEAEVALDEEDLDEEAEEQLEEKEVQGQPNPA